MKNIRIIIVLSLIFLTVFFWTINKDNQIEQDLFAKDGYIELKEIENNAIYRLKGEWFFYPSMFMDDKEFGSTVIATRTIEHVWVNEPNFKNGFGYASYRLELSGLLPNTEYGVLLEEAGSSYQLWVNGKLVLSNGKIAKNSLMAVNASYTDKHIFISDQTGHAEFILEVDNYVKADGGVLIAPLIGHVDDIIYYYETSLIIELFVFASLASISMIFLLLTIIVNDRRSLFMAMLAGLFALRVISTGNHIIYLLNPFFEFPLIWILRFEYLSVFLTLPVFILLANTFKIFEFNQNYRRIAYTLAILFSLFSFVIDHSGLTFMYLIFRVLVGFYGLHFLYYSIKSYRNAHLNLISIIVLSSSIIGALISVNYIRDTRYSFYYIVFIFIIFITATVLQRFSIIHTKFEHLENIVKIDPLTKLWNRAYLNELKFDLSRYETNEVFYVLFIDVNNFKEINDQYGHKIGDEVLRITARRLRNSCHEADMIFRLGGDEFIIIAHMKESSAIEKVIKRIRDNFNEPFTMHDIHFNLSLAIGYQAFNPNIDDFESIIALSDKKMYEDKRRQANP